MLESTRRFINKFYQGGHSIGNHTYHHLNGWKTKTEEYLADVSKASTVINSNLFRPPYGKIAAGKAKGLAQAMNQEKVAVVMWDVLSADFDKSISREQCLQNVLKNTSAGSIIVFHDSEKAFGNLEYVLPEVLSHLRKEDYKFEKI